MSEICQQLRRNQSEVAGYRREIQELNADRKLLRHTIAMQQEGIKLLWQALKTENAEHISQLMAAAQKLLDE
jgi:mevalonate kinase